MPPKKSRPTHGGSVHSFIGKVPRCCGPEVGGKVPQCPSIWTSLGLERGWDGTSVAGSVADALWRNAAVSGRACRYDIGSME